MRYQSHEAKMKFTSRSTTFTSRSTRSNKSTGIKNNKVIVKGKAKAKFHHVLLLAFLLCFQTDFALSQNKQDLSLATGQSGSGFGQLDPGFKHLDSEFGQAADSIQIDIHSIPEPRLSNSKKSFVTDNHFGFDVLNTESNWVIEDFLKNCHENSIVMDVGSGYGALSREALKKGAIVISNDISINQLHYNLKHVSKAELSKLYLNEKDIRDISLKPNSLDLIIFHRVLHFFKGEEIEHVLKKAHLWLKPGGKIYIVMMSKDHIAFRDKIDYDDSKKWPGEDLVVVEKHLPDQAYALPKTLHVISKETLFKNLSEVGFKVENCDYVSLQKVGGEKNRDGLEAVGAIGRKLYASKVNDRN